MGYFGLKHRNLRVLSEDNVCCRKMFKDDKMLTSILYNLMQPTMH